MTAPDGYYWYETRKGWAIGFQKDGKFWKLKMCEEYMPVNGILEVPIHRNMPQPEDIEDL